MEFPVYISGKPCVDMDGVSGLCTKRLKSTDDLIIKIDPQQYDYTRTLACSKGIPVTPDVNVLKNAVHEIRIVAKDITLSSFTCIGEIFPLDRTAPISAKFKITITVYDAQYTAREGIYLTKDKSKNILVLGQYARSAWVFDQDKWKRYAQSTAIEVKGDLTKVRAYSESYAMRFNSFNMVW